MTDATSTPTTGQPELDQLISEYRLVTEESTRELDWKVRETAFKNGSLDPKARYLLVTYGAAGLTSERLSELSTLEKRIGSLLLVPVGKHTGDDGRLGWLSRVKFNVDTNFYAFGNVPEDCIGYMTWISLVTDRAVEFASSITSNWPGRRFPMRCLGAGYLRDELVLWLRCRHAITPKPVPYHEDERGYTFDAPLNWYDEFGPALNHCGCRPELILGDDVATWFEDHSKSEKLHEYLALLRQNSAA